MNDVSLTSPLGKPRIEVYNGNDFEVNVPLRPHVGCISAKKALEAFWILTRNPGINNRNEYLAVTNDFLPFATHCELQKVRSATVVCSTPHSPPLVDQHGRTAPAVDPLGEFVSPTRPSAAFVGYVRNVRVVKALGAVERK